MITRQDLIVNIRSSKPMSSLKPLDLAMLSVSFSTHTVNSCSDYARNLNTRVTPFIYKLYIINNVVNT